MSEWLRVRLLQGTTAGQPGLWVIGSIVAAVLLTNSAWALRQHLPRILHKDRPSGSSPVSGEARLRDGPGEKLPALAWLGTALFLLLPPLASWPQGALSLYFLGLTELDWLTGLGAGGMLAVTAGIAFLIGWVVYRRSLPIRASSSGHWWLVPIDAALYQWHWAFYRSAAIIWLVSMTDEVGFLVAETSSPLATTLLGAASSILSQPLYWGSWLGLGLVALEWSLNPFARAGLRSGASMERGLRRVGLAIITTALFTLARNLWLCLALDIVLETTISAWLPGTASEPTVAEPPR